MTLFSLRTRGSSGECTDKHQVDMLHVPKTCVSLNWNTFDRDICTVKVTETFQKWSERGHSESCRSPIAAEFKEYQTYFCGYVFSHMVLHAVYIWKRGYSESNDSCLFLQARDIFHSIFCSFEKRFTCTDLKININAICSFSFYKQMLPGAVARSEASSLGMQAAPSSIPTSSTFFRGDLVMKAFLRPFSLFRWFKKSSCQLLAKECALSTGKLPRRLAQEQCG